VIIIDPPSPTPVSEINEQQHGSNENNSDSTNMDIDTPNEVSSPNRAVSLPNKEASLPTNGALLPNKDINKPKMEEILKTHNMIDIDKDIIDEVKLMSPQQQLQALLTRTQQLKQLYFLRENVLKLLRVLVPELEVSDFKGKYKDQTIDDLLQQVLEQAEKSDEIIIDS